MKFYTFGNKEKTSIMLFPGTCCHWKENFGSAIPLLEKNYYVICVSYDGFDETENTVFTTMIQQTEKIEAYIQKELCGEVDIAYGSSLGGSFVGLLMERNNVRIEYPILGSSDLDEDSKLVAKIKASIMVPMIYKMMQTGKLPKFFQKRLASKPKEEQPYFESMLSIFLNKPYIQKESIYNQFYSDLITPLQNNIAGNVYIFYATKMGDTYLERYKQHFSNPTIFYQDYQHEELLISYPEQWVEEIRKVRER